MMWQRIAIAVWVSVSCAATQAMAQTSGEPSVHERLQYDRLTTLRAAVANGDIGKAQSLIEAARAEVAQAQVHDPRLADADELQAVSWDAQKEAADAAAQTQEAKQGAGPSEDGHKLAVDAWALMQKVIALRKVQSPAEPRLVGLSLGEAAIIAEDAGEYTAEEQVLRECKEAYLSVFAAADLRRAALLEQYARLYDEGYHRPLMALDLRLTALQQRRDLAKGPDIDLAQALIQTAVLEGVAGRNGDEDKLLDEALTDLLQLADAARSSEDKSNAAYYAAQAYSLKAKLAARADRFDDARTFIAKSQATAKDSDYAVLADWAATDIRRQQLESEGDQNGALAAVEEGLAIARKGGMDDVTLAKMRIQEARLLHELGRDTEAAASVTAIYKSFDQTALSVTSYKAQNFLLAGRVAASLGNSSNARMYTTIALALLKRTATEIPVLFGTTRKAAGDGFGVEANHQLAFGEGRVIVPGSMPVSGVGEASLGNSTPLDTLQIEPWSSTDGKHEAAARVFIPLMENELAEIAGARLRAAKTYPDAVLVFVHGFGTTFEFSIKRAGQIGRDIAFDGPIFAFSWPSQGMLGFRAYEQDQATAKGSAADLAKFLTIVASVTGKAKIHIIAHSMGNQILVDTLTGIKNGSLVAPGLIDRLGEIIFASPDVDGQEFKNKAGKLQEQGKTLYASKNDAALNLSWLVNALSPRAGTVKWGILGRGAPVTVPNLDSIDISDAGADWFGNHDLYVTNPAVANDVRKLLQFGQRPPPKRTPTIVPEGTGADRYWVLKGALDHP